MVRGLRFFRVKAFVMGLGECNRVLRNFCRCRYSLSSVVPFQTLGFGLYGLGSKV